MLRTGARPTSPQRISCAQRAHNPAGPRSDKKGMAKIEIKCTVAANLEGRLDRVVQGLIQRSRAQVRGLFDHDCVQLNDKPCNEPGTPVQTGDVVAVCYDPRIRYRE